MVREPDATLQPAPQDNHLMSKHRVLGFEPQLRLERKGQDGQNETEQPDHSVSLGVMSVLRARLPWWARERAVPHRVPLRKR